MRSASTVKATTDDNHMRTGYRTDVGHVVAGQRINPSATRWDCCCSGFCKGEKEEKVSVQSTQAAASLFRNSFCLQYLQLSQAFECLFIYAGNLIVVKLQSFDRGDSFEDPPSDWVELIVGQVTGDGKECVLIRIILSWSFIRVVGQVKGNPSVCGSVLIKQISQTYSFWILVVVERKLSGRVFNLLWFKRL